MCSVSFKSAGKKCGKDGWRFGWCARALIFVKACTIVYLLAQTAVVTNSYPQGKEKLSSDVSCNSQTMEQVGDTCGIELVEDGFGFLISEDKEGAPSSQIVRRFTMSNQNGMTVQVITYGGIITSIQVPDKDGEMDDVVLGFDSMSGYLSEKNPYFGATIGRVANRIRDGKFKIGNQVFNVSQNKPGYMLHGGFKGFDKQLWESHVEGSKLTLSYLSKDGEEGFPGTLLTHVTYQLTSSNELITEIKATTTKPTPVNIAGHSYFNLAGHASGSKGLLEHVVSINADKYTVTDKYSIPTGDIEDVFGTYLDLRTPSALKDRIPLVPGLGFDNNFCVSPASEGNLNYVGSVKHVESGRTLDIYSNQPGVQFYTSNYLPDPEAPEEDKIRGKEGIPYHKWGALCLETQNYPDAVNHADFPDSILTPGKEYFHKMIYRFGAVE